MRDTGLVPTWLDDAIRQHPDKVQLRLAASIFYYWELWDIDLFLKETWRWN